MVRERSERKAPLVEQEWLSTIGEPVDGGATVVLKPTAQAAELGLEELRLGAAADDLPEAVCVGSHESLEGVIPLETAHDLHCQFALRKFSIKDDKEELVHEALFLRDVASATFVNGQPAFTPWQWLHDGDEISLRAPVDTPRSEHWPFYQVHYCSHLQIPRSAASLLKAPVPSGNGSSSSRARGGGGAARGRSRKLPVSGVVQKTQYGREIIGKVIDVTYMDSNDTYRVKIVGYDEALSWHDVDSTGYSVWHDEEDGDDTFTDKIDLNSMTGLSRVDFVDDEELKRERLEREEMEEQVQSIAQQEDQPREIEETKQPDQQAQLEKQEDDVEDKCVEDADEGEAARKRQRTS